MSGLRCAQCKNKVLQKSDAGIRLRSKGPLLFQADGTCMAQCFWCGTEVTLPVRLTVDVPQDAPVKFVLAKNGV